MLERDLSAKAKQMVVERQELGETIDLELNLRTSEVADCSAVDGGAGQHGAAHGTSEGTGIGTGVNGGGSMIVLGAEDPLLIEENQEAYRKAYLRVYETYLEQEIELLERLGNACYTQLDYRSRWKALRWLSDTVAESEEGPIRAELERRQTAGRVYDKLQVSLGVAG